jgi:hypothetical protein
MFKQSQYEIQELQKTCAILAKENDMLKAREPDKPTSGGTKRPGTADARPSKRQQMKSKEQIAVDQTTELFEGIDLIANRE